MKTTTPGSRYRYVRFLGFVVLTTLAGQDYGSRVVVQALAPPCDIVCENAKTDGVTPQSQWDIVGAGDPNIQGFTTDLSVNRGETVHFKISSTTGYGIEIYRLGYYGGNGARKIATIANLPGNVTQPGCVTDRTNNDPSTGTGLVDCGNWSVSTSWQTDVNVPSGIFIAKLIRSGGGASHIPFIVRDDNYAADLLFQTSDTTWQAYNQWGGGSLYCGGPISNAGTVYAVPGCAGRAVRVSYNRPFDTRAHDATSFLFNAEYPMVRWLERNGYAVKYWTGVDTDRFGANTAIGLRSANKPKIFLSVGHDEYWSGTQRANVEAARDAGVHLAFFSGNEMFWKTRWENSIANTTATHRTLVGYKESLNGIDIDGQGSPWTGTWRDGRFVKANPENALTGTLWTVNTGSAAIEVPEPMGKLRLWRGTNVATLAAGQSATLGVDTLGYEWDEDVDNGFRPAGLMRLSSTTMHDVVRVLDDNGVVVGQGPATHNLTMYRHASGAYVFGAGTVQWAWGLDSEHDRKPLHPVTQLPVNTHDVRMQQATVNLFADMGNVQPHVASLVAAGLAVASPSNDTTAPDSAFTGPAAGSIHSLNAPLFVRGTAVDTGGRVAAIEVSTDGGGTWERATGTTNWVYRWISDKPGVQTIQSRAIDDSGNVETSSPSLQVSFTSPVQAPGGPVLVVTSAANPFTTYYTEILRTEGLNLFNTADIATVSETTLAGYDTVILGEMPLTPAQVAMFGTWVTNGGNLIAMRPDKQLYGLLGLTEAAGTLANAYLKIGAQSGVPTGGIVSETIQFHGIADRATLNGAASVATLYSDANTTTAHPAITLRGVGEAGGQAVAFLYDLARSVVLTHQGNPAWSGQNRDLIDPIRSNDLFYGAANGDPQTDWVNLSKVHIPQADEQQRLLANTILHVTQDRKPLPRFWYFPRDEKAVVVMTGDAHGQGTSTFRLNELNNLSAPNCSVNDWACLRGTAYIYPSTPSLFDGGPGGVASYIAQGHEIALHPNTGCANYTAASLDETFATQLEQLALNYPSMPPPRTSRTHCIVWSDYTSQAEVELQHGIRYDTTYYYWPGTWLQNRPGFMGGSGMPMRFAKETGEIIDVYQDVTEMIDENNSSHTFPFFADRLLDRAIGAEGYYGAFTANMHGDGSDDSDIKMAAIVQSATERGVPVVSAAQMLDWLDGRNNSSFGSVTWNSAALTLSFTVTRASGANGLRGMVPAFSGGALAQITRNGTAIPFTLATIKGVSYASFDATTGGYQATYQADNIPPVISSVNAIALTSETAAVTWNTSEAATSRVDFGTNATTLDRVATNNAHVGSHSLTLTGLLPDKRYYYRVTSSDFFGNTSTFPAAGDAALSFTTPPQLQSFTDTTAANFSAGTPGAAAFVAQTSDGEVILKPTDGSEFFGTTIPAGWTSGTWNATGSVSVANGQLLLNDAWARLDRTYTAGRSLEFVANFGADAFQHSGFAQNFNCHEPWAIFSTMATTGQLYARTTTDGCTAADVNTLIPGTWLGSSHRYRIDWNASDVVYFVDGVEVARHTVQIAPQMQMLAASDFDEFSNPFTLTLDWERMSPYPSSGVYQSRVFDAGSPVNWYNIAWTAGLPANTGVAIAVRTGANPIPDGTWSSFATIAASGDAIPNVGARRYLQYQATLSTSNSYLTPELRSVTVNHAVAEANTAPVATDDAVTISEDTPRTFPATGPGSLTANDTDTQASDQLTVIAVEGATNGSVVLNLDGSVTFTPTANFSGVAAFTYTVSDGALNDDGIVMLTVNAVNDAPVGVADPSPAAGSFYQAIEDTVLNVPAATGVLVNDSDVDSDRATLQAVIDRNPAHGTVTLNPDGSFTYAPAANYSGPDGFFYKVSDGISTSESTGVAVLVQGLNDPPVAKNDSYAVSRSGVPISLSSLVRSGQTVTGTTRLEHGFTTAHDVLIEGASQAEYNGVFRVTVTGSKTFTYSVVGEPVSPATGSIRATAQDTTRTFAAPGVIANDLDNEGQPLIAAAGSEQSSVKHGTLIFNADGSFTYTPDDGYVGIDTFTYSVSDGIIASNLATVTITVHNEIAAAVVGEGGGVVATGETPTITDPLETSVTTPIAGEVTIEQGPISPNNAASGYTFLGQQVDIKISTITELTPLTNPNAPLLITFSADASLVAAGQSEATLQIFRNGTRLENCPAGQLTLANYPCVAERTALPGGDLQFTVKTLAPSQWNVGAFIASDAAITTAEDTAFDGNVSSLSGHPNAGDLTFGTEIAPMNGTLVLARNGAFRYTPRAGFNGEDRFTYSAADGNGGRGIAIVSITVTPVNDAPAADAQSVVVNEDGTTDITLTGSDIEGSALTYTVVSGPAHGSLSGTAPNLRYTPAANYEGLDAFTFTTRDGLLTSEPGIVTINVNPVNDAPTANNDSVTVGEDSGGTALNVLANDSIAPDRDETLTITNKTNGAKGTVAIVNNGSAVSYTPDANFNGTDAFTYTVNDGHNGTSTATVTVTVSPANDAPTASAQEVVTNEDASKVITLAGADIDGDTLTFNIVTGPQHGTAVRTLDKVTYTPAANYNGTDTFTFSSHDGSLASAPATVTITVDAVNDPPTAINDTATVVEDGGAQNVNVLANDSIAPDAGETLTVTATTNGANGTVSITDGSVFYRPNANFNGTDTFTYTVSDGNGGTATATVTVTITPVPDAPIAQTQTVTTAEDTPQAVTLQATDVDDQASGLSFSIVSQPTRGLLSGVPPNVTYTPGANYHGADSFTFRATDVTGLVSNVATVNVTISATNDAPVAAGQAVTTDEDTARIISVAGSDVDGDELTFTLVTAPAHGTLSGTLPNVTYTPSLNYSGSDSFRFTADDGVVASLPATVSITVAPINDAPAATSQSVTATEDTNTSITLAGTDVDNSTLTFAFTQPTHGTVSGTGATITYRPAADYTGPDSFTFTASDGTLASGPATVSITVAAVNDAPVATAQSVTTPEDTDKSITLAGTDVDSSTLTFAFTQPTRGTVIGTGATVTYKPASNYNGPDSFTFTASDGTLTSAPVTVSITVDPVNDAPVATLQSVTTPEDTDKPITLAATDVDSSTLTFTFTQPGHGILTGTAPNLTYKPAANYSGPDNFTFTASDGASTSAPVTVSITVTAVNDTPTAAGQIVTTPEDTGKAITLAGTDVEGSALTFVFAQPAHGIVTGTGAAVTYTPTANYAGPDSFTFTASDGASTSAPATVSITVTAVNDTPVATGQNVTATEDTPRAITLAGSDVEGSALTFTFTQPGNGTLTGTAPNLTYAPAANYSGPDSFSFTVSDGTLISTSATVSITVNAVNDTPTANLQSLTATEDTAATITLTGSDVEGTALTFAFAQPAHGTVAGTGPTVTYTPASNYSGPDSFTFTVSDGTTISAPAAVTITVTAVNDTPAATAQSVTTNEDTARAITLSGSDAEGSTLTYAFTQPSHGTVTGTGATVTYSPAANYSGPDTFTFTVRDGALTSPSATVTITVNAVNDVPVAVNDGFTMSRSGVPVGVSSIVRTGSTANATTTLAHGFSTGHAVRIEGAAETEYNGSFTITATGPTTFSYTVAGTPASPATGAIRATAEDSTRTFAAPGVIGNDTDVEGQPLTATLGATTPNGTLVFNGDGSFTYTPNPNFLGVDSFTYTVTDGSGVSAITTATITVRDEITVVTVASGGTVATGTIPTIEDPLETSVTMPIAGQVTIEQGPITPVNAAPSYTFLGQQVNISISTITDASPLTDPNAPLLITLTADGTLVAPGETVDTLAVFRNGVALVDCPQGPLTASNYPCVSQRTTLTGGDLQFTVKTLAPSQWNLGARIARNASMATAEDAALNGSVKPLTGHPNPSSLTFTRASSPAHGTVAIAPDGGFTYTPALDYSGPDSFTFTASDGVGGSGTGTVSITVNAVNEAPTATPQPNVTTNEDTPRAITLAGTDPDGDTLTFTVLTQPTNGTLTGSGASVTYTPAANYSGPDSFTFKARDAALDSAPATVNITVAAVNDAPTISSIGDQTTSGTPVGPVSFVVGDVESLATLAVTGQSSNTALVPNANIVFGGNGANRTVTVTPVAGQSGPATITVTVSDGALSASDAFVVTVNAGKPSTTSTPTSSLATSTFGANVTLTTTVSGSGGPPTGSVEFFDNGISLGTATLSGGTASLTTNKIAAGTRSITAKYLGSASFTASTSGAFTQTVNKAAATSTLALPTPGTPQYSDLVTFKATATPIGGIAPANYARFKVGTQVMGTAPFVLNSTTGIFEASLTTALLETVAGQVKPGAKQVTLEYVEINPSVTLTNKFGSVSIRAEDALTKYVGPTTVTTCATCTTATIRLEAEVTELADGTAGDVRLATVGFLNRATGALVGAATLDTAKSTSTKAYYFFNWTVTVSGASQTFTVGTTVSNYYTRNSTTENATVTVVKQ